jgi:hypothetical protein
MKVSKKISRFAFNINIARADWGTAFDLIESDKIL